MLGTFGDKIEVVDAGLPTSGPVAEQVTAGLTSWQGRDFPKALELTRRVLPNDVFEGFYVAKIAKRGSTVDTK